MFEVNVIYFCTQEISIIFLDAPTDVFLILPQSNMESVMSGDHGGMKFIYNTVLHVSSNNTTKSAIEFPLSKPFS